MSSGNRREVATSPDSPTSSSEAIPAPGSRLGLSRDRILQGALALVDREGLEAFTMRRLAEELGVGTMTIYGYFRSRDELLDAVVDAGGQAIAALASELEGGGSWKPRLRELMMGVRRSLLEHPGVVELRYKRPLLSPGALTVTEAGMRILRDAGFSNRDAGRAYRILFVYTFGFCAFGPGPRSETDRDRSVEALSALPVDRYPILVEAAREASDSMVDPTLYEVGLDALLDCLERTLASGGR